MLVAMTAIFVGCWLPLNAFLLALEYNDAVDSSPYALVIFLLAHLIGVSSTVYNPFLYAWMNDNFRRQFRLVVPCLIPEDGRTRSSAAAVADIGLGGDDGIIGGSGAADDDDAGGGDGVDDGGGSNGRDRDGDAGGGAGGCRDGDGGDVDRDEDDDVDVDLKNV